MTGLNHAVTGALVAVAIKRPEFALPAAFLSHFAIDMLPHWEYRPPVAYKQLVAVIDVTSILALALILSITVNASASLIIAGVFLGILPDAMWLPNELYNKKSPMDRHTPLHLARRFHLSIQNHWGNQGLYVEVLWFVVMITLIYVFY